MLEHWIWLAERPHLSDRKKNILLQHFGTPEHIWDASADELLQAEELSQQAMEALLDHSLASAQEAMDVCEKKGIQTVKISDHAYPRRLAEIYDPPVLLFYKGVLPDFDSLPVIGVVGTRKPSVYGVTTAHRLGGEIAACGGLVISGMADGIDAAAMKGALEAGGSTVAVLGCGADVVYPKKNRSLYEDTCRYGCVISEFLPGTEPLKWNFPRRNRIISGLSCGVLVVEAPERSGSVITAHCALEQGRDVFAVPGNVDQVSSAGSNRLLREGAGVIGSGWDVVSEYASRFPEAVRKPPAEERSRSRRGVPAGKKSADTAGQFSEPEHRIEENDKKGIDNAKPSTYIDKTCSFSALTPEEQIITQVLMQGPQLTDDVIADSGLPSGRALSLLTLLELKGIIRRLPGKRLSLKDG